MGSSTPRSPRATMTASARARISPIRSTAGRVSSLATMGTGRGAMSARRPMTSAASRTKDCATRSTPRSSARASASRSRSVMAGSERRSAGTLSPAPERTTPPRATSVTTVSPDPRTTSSTAPSASRTRSPGRRSRPSPGYVVGAPSASPGAPPGRRRNRAPASSVTRPSRSSPRRIFGPGRSAMIAGSAPRLAAAWRAAATRAACSSGVPWDRFTRRTSAPASRSPARTAGSALAGPSVHTSLTLRLMAPARSAGRWSAARGGSPPPPPRPARAPAGDPRRRSSGSPPGSGTPPAR
ncbi:MAG: hypothetical protein KatS3mg014_2133 [Actinomycetota bacterium]|nr:MAG: hypothetical protein KatS3mg014_2133 [Actinomycetota bacterium]